MYSLELLPLSTDQQDPAASATLELSELLIRADIAVDDAQEQIQKTRILLTEATKTATANGRSARFDGVLAR